MMGSKRNSTLEDMETWIDGVERSSSSSSSLAAKAIRASSAYRDSSLASAYSAHHPTPTPSTPFLKDSRPMKNCNEPKQSFWGTLARKAKSILEDDASFQQSPPPKSQIRSSKLESPTFIKSLGAITSSLNYIGNAVEEGLSVVENRTAGIIQETRKHIKKKPISSVTRDQEAKQSQMHNQEQPQTHTHLQIQLKASRDVAMAMAAKAKLLLRELKSVKADLAFAKQRCAQLEEENKVLRESRNRRHNPEDDDLIRLQLETLLAEKARLAHENSVYARENRFLREVVEYHQLTMQDVVYLDEKTEEVTEMYPIKVASTSTDTSAPGSPHLSQHLSSLLPELAEIPRRNASSTLCPPSLTVQGTKGPPNSSV